MKNINTGLGYLAVAAVSIVAIIVTREPLVSILLPVIGFCSVRNNNSNEEDYDKSEDED